MKHFILVIAFSVLWGAFGISSQLAVFKIVKSQVEQPLSKPLWDSIMAMPDLKTASPMEKEAVYFINLARLYPVLYRDSILNPFLRQNPSFNDKYGKSLGSMLGENQPSGLVQGHLGLRRIALGHATDLMKQGAISHTGSDGRGPADRLQSIKVNCGSECVHASTYTEASEMVLSLLIDQGIPSLGHRKALLDAGSDKVGVGIVQKGRMYYMVVNMACR